MADKPAPILSILIVNYNGLQHLEVCFASIYDQDFHDFEVILVDNASRDGSLEFTRARFPQVRIVEAESNLGFAGGNNHGLPFCSGDHVFFLNNDTRLEPGALRELVVSIRKFPQYRVFACFLLKFSNPDLADSAGDTIYRGGFITSFAHYPARLFDSPREVLAACAGAAVYSRALLNELGGFDEDFFLIFEDMDLSLRARHQGESILFLPGARVYHKGSATLGGTKSPTTMYFGTRNFFLLYLKNFPLITLCKCLPGMGLKFGMHFFQTARRGQFKIFLKAVFDCLRMTPRMLRKRRDILSQSKLDRRDLEKLFRRHWLQERLAFRRGNLDLTL